MINLLISVSKSEYLCEIASVVHSQNGWLDLEKLPKEDRTEMTYEDRFCFYMFIYDKCNSSKKDMSLLQIIYDEIGENLMDMFAEFLSTYKEIWTQKSLS